MGDSLAEDSCFLLVPRTPRPMPQRLLLDTRLLSLHVPEARVFRCTGQGLQAKHVSFFSE